jgi:hypothetical protein
MMFCQVGKLLAQYRPLISQKRLVLPLRGAFSIVSLAHKEAVPIAARYN